jgi:4,5-dihydroxyphthalate decarboxylase
VRLRTLLGDHPATRALRRGQLVSPLLSLTFADVDVPNRAFKRVVRDLEFDVAELALMTFLMARSRDIPLRLLPVVVFSRNPLPHLVCDPERRRLMPAELGGCRVGVRSYTTTTAVWIRALLSDRYAVPLDACEWVALEEAHVAGVPDPPMVQRAPGGSDLLTMLHEGVVDAAIVDRVPDGGRFVPVVPDPDEACRRWEETHGARTLHHVMVVRESLAADDIAISELLRLFRASRHAAGDPALTPVGLAENRRNLEAAIAAADAQGLLARPLAVDDLVGHAASAALQ